MTTVSEPTLTTSGHPREAHVYNNAAELLRNNPASQELELDRDEYLRLSTDQTINHLLASLTLEFGREHAGRLSVSICKEASLTGERRYYARFRLRLT